MNRIRKDWLPLPMLASTQFLVAGIWYCALIMSLRGVAELAGIRFFWTAALGLAPLVCLGLTGLAIERYLRSDRSNRVLVVAAVTVGLSPWLWLVAGGWFGVR